jgi:hypothetical protein
MLVGWFLGKLAGSVITDIPVITFEQLPSIRAWIAGPIERLRVSPAALPVVLEQLGHLRGQEINCLWQLISAVFRQQAIHLSTCRKKGNPMQVDN